MRAPAEAGGVTDDREQPVLLLAATGVFVQSLALGAFARELTADRPIFVSSRDPIHVADAMRDAGIRGGAVTFIEEPPDGSSFSNPNSVMHLLKEGARSNRSTQILIRARTSRQLSLRLRGTRAAGRVTGALGLLPAAERIYLKWLERTEIVNQWRQQLQSLRPAAVVSTNLTLTPIGSRIPNPDLPALIAARQMKIPTGTLIQSWDNLSSKPAILPRWVDRYWCWSEKMAAELLSLNPHIERSQIEITGSPLFDWHFQSNLVEAREPFCRRHGLDPKRPMILCGTGTRQWLPNESRTVADLAVQLRRRLPESQLLIRLHPKDDGRKWGSLLEDLTRSGVAIQRPAPELHLDLGGFHVPDDYFREQLSAICHAAVVLNTASTLTVDAAVMDRPVISIGYDLEPDPAFPEGRAAAFQQSEHFAPLVATGGVRVVTSPEECVQAIGEYLRDPSLHRNERSELAHHVIGPTDGESGRRLALAVLELARGDTTADSRRAAAKAGGSES